MSSFRATVVLAAILVTLSLLLTGGAGVLRASGKNPVANSLAAITIDYPLAGSLFPPEITAPTFLWRDADESSKHWIVEVTFADHSRPLRIEAAGEYWQLGEIDPEVGAGDELKQVAAEHATTRIWKPDAKTWATIKQHSVKAPATVAITGFADDDLKQPISSGTVSISTSTDPVGAPVFYRDVPLLLSPPSAKGAIAPLPPFAIPLIKWKLRNIAEPQGRTMMDHLPTCANCHSFSTDGKTLGIDLDGPKNDKGLYALVPLTKQTTIRNQDVVRWSSFQEHGDSSEPTVKRFGFMSQVSPDGRYVVTSIAPPGLGNEHQQENPDFVPGLSDRLFSTNYKHVSFTQVFYPMRGVLAWYDREQKKLRPLPGADDPRYVQTSAFWSPDGKYLIFSRAEARDPYPPGAPKPEYANDPNEPQIQYDLYRIPFNEGRGGKAEPIVGASQNGMSNNFPKVSPDGRWIVFVQNHNGLLMRPDSKLYIIPFAGGKARLMNCNLSLMNSWHSFSPNGHWMVFSSKARSPYTQLLLTHIDAHGNDTPAILIENTTAANRAVNIPEFVNVPADGLEKIDPQATEFYGLFNQAWELMENNRMAEALPVLREALKRQPDDALTHYGIATALTATGHEGEAVDEYRKACTLNTRNAAWFAQFATSLALNGNLDEAVENWRKSLAIKPSDFGAESDLGTALFETGHAKEGYEHLKKAIAMSPKFADAHNQLGWELAKAGRFDEAVDELQKAIELTPNSAEYRVNLGSVLASRNDFAGAAAVLEKAVEISQGKDWRCLDMLASTYDKLGRAADAVRSEQQALDLAHLENDSELEQTLRSNLERFQQDATQAK